MTRAGGDGNKRISDNAVMRFAAAGLADDPQSLAGRN